MYTGRIFCLNEEHANAIFDNLTKLFGFPQTNFNFNGNMMKGDPEGLNEHYEIEENKDDFIKNENIQIHKQIDMLSKENLSLIREVAFLKETIKDLSGDFEYGENQNQIKGFDYPENHSQIKNDYFGNQNQIKGFDRLDSLKELSPTGNLESGIYGNLESGIYDQDQKVEDFKNDSEPMDFGWPKWSDNKIKDTKIENEQLFDNDNQHDDFSQDFSQRYL